MDLNTVTEVASPPEVGDWRAGDAWLAGGTYLFSQPQPDVRRLLDLPALGWPPLTMGADGLSIAATCTIAELYAADLPIAGLVRQCCRAFVASFKVWNEATVGGNLCTALPAGPMISLTAALDGVCVLLSPAGTQRRLPVTEFVTGEGTTALRPGELLRSIEIPAAALEARTAFRQGSLHTLGRSAALVIGRAGPAHRPPSMKDRTRGPGAAEHEDLQGDRGGPEHGFVLTITASTPRPIQVRFPHVPDSATLRQRVQLEDLVLDDLHGRRSWRRHLTTLFAEAVRAELR